MDFKNICWCYLFFVSIKILEAAKLYVLDLPSDEENILLNNYDDYDPITEYDDEDHNARYRIVKAINNIKNDAEKNVKAVVCERLFGSMFGNKLQHMRCLNALKTNTRTYDPYYIRPNGEVNKDYSYHVNINDVKLNDKFNEDHIFYIKPNDIKPNDEVKKDRIFYTKSNNKGLNDKLKEDQIFYTKFNNVGTNSKINLNHIFHAKSNDVIPKDKLYNLNYELNVDHIHHMTPNTIVNKNLKRPDKQKTYTKYERQIDTPFSEGPKFSEDYLDVRDLGRTEAFANDYIDVDDFKVARAATNCKQVEVDEFGQITNANCIPESRKNILNIDANNEMFLRSRKKSDSDSSDDDDSTQEESESVEMQKSIGKSKRYKVVSNEDSNNSDGNSDDEQKSDDELKNDNDSSKDENILSDEFANSEQKSEQSIEVTTKRPKSKGVKKIKGEDNYLYLQGNRYFDKNDFRRRIKTRLPHFMPNRFQWDEDDYQHLGYFWFNGVKGKYTP